MRWEIRGASMDTGKDVVAVLDAPNENEARRLAGNKGVAIASIKPDEAQAGGAAQATSLDYRSPMTTAPPSVDAAIAAARRRENLAAGARLAGATGVVIMKIVGFVIAAIGLMALGLFVLWLIFGSDETTPRFASDNAIGATANAMEGIRSGMMSVRLLLALVAALLLCILVRLSIPPTRRDG